MWTSGKHRGFCIVTNRDSVLLESYFCGRIETTSRNGILMFLCIRVSEFHSCLFPFIHSFELGYSKDTLHRGQGDTKCPLTLRQLQESGVDVLLNTSEWVSIAWPFSVCREIRYLAKGILFPLRYTIIKCEINILNCISKEIVSLGYTHPPTGIQLLLASSPRFSILIWGATTARSRNEGLVVREAWGCRAVFG